MKFNIEVPQNFVAYKPFQVLLYIMACYGLWVVPAVSSFYAMNTSFILSLSLTLISGFGYFAVAGIAHEGLHGNLAQSARNSVFLGALLSTPVLGFYAPGFYWLHWCHHRLVNTPQDPVYRHYSRFKHPVSRLLAARLLEGPTYFTHTLKMLAEPSKYALPWLPSGTVRYLSVATLAGKALFALLLVGSIVYLPNGWLFGLYVFLLPSIVSVFIASASPYLEHAETDSFICARSQNLRLLTVLRFGANFHLEHHYFSSIPCWRLPRFHRYLHRRYPEMASYIDQTVLQTLSNLSSRRSYGTG